MRFDLTRPPPTIALTCDSRSRRRALSRRRCSRRVVFNRYYDPSTGQFLSIDPDVAETGQPYTFTGDDPLNATDPTGLRGWYCMGGRSVYYKGNKYGRSGTGRCEKTLQSGAKPKDFAKVLLYKEKAPYTSKNIKIVVAWERAESGNDWNTYVPQAVPTKFNPLNATQREPGSSATAGAGSPQSYTSWAEGIDATSSTLNAGDDGYPAIVSALRAGNDPLAVEEAVNQSGWGTHSHFYDWYDQGYNYTQPSWNQP